MRELVENKTIKRKKYFLLGIILIIYVLFCEYVYKVDLKDRKVILNDSNVSTMGELKNNNDIKQTIELYTHDVVGIILYPATYGNDNAGAGDMNIEILDENDRVIEHKNLHLKDIEDNEKMSIKLGKTIYRNENNKIIVHISFKNMRNRDKLTFYVGNGESDNLKYNNKEKQYSLKIGMISNSLDCFSLACLVCATLIGVMIIITYYILFIKEKKSISMLFIPIAIVLGIVYLMFIPEYETPDEMRHMETAYYMSNQILGESEDGNVYMRKCDYDHLYGDDDNNNTFFHKSFNREKYNNYFYNLIFDNGNDNSLIDVGSTPLNAKQYLYFFSGIGILLGRLLGLNSIITFLIGAFLNYLFAVLGIYYAIRKFPICKEMILLISILPITIQQLTSYSYDCMIIVLAFIFISLAMCVLMDNANKIDFFVLLIVSILLIQAKSGAYAPMILLLPLIGLIKKKENKKIFKICIGILGISVLFMIGGYLGNAGSSISKMSSSSDLSWTSGKSYSIGYLLDHIDILPKIFWGTLISMGSEYFYTTFGGGLGWFSIAVPWWIIITLFMCILMVTFSEEKNYSSNRIIKVGMLIIVAVSIALVCVALLLDWTPITTYIIKGVQGRYFLPVLPLLFIGMQSDCIKIEKGLSYKAVFISILMQPFIIQTLIASS